MKKCFRFLILAILFVLICTTTSTLYAQGDLSLYRFKSLEPREIVILQELGYQPEFDEWQEQALLALSSEEADQLRRMGFDFELLRHSLAENIDEGYHTFDEVWAYLDSLNNIYPDLMVLDTLGYSQFDGLPLPLVKISDNPEMEEDEITVLYDGIHHAREPISIEICLKLIAYLLENYGNDTDVDFWVDETEIFILPMINPEGWKYITDGNLPFPYWRKNKRDNDENGSFSQLTDGVDLNRNYPAAWSAGDPVMSSEIYRGPWPFSESELLARKQLVLQQKPVMSITYHSYGEVVIYANSLGGTYFPDNDYISQVAQQLASNITNIYGSNYDWGYFMIEAGLSNFWMYTEAGCFEYCIETGQDFIPSYQMADAVSDENLQGALFLLDRVRGPGITGLVTDSVTGEPLAATYKVLEMYHPMMTPRSADSLHGRFFRPLMPGTYSIEFTMDGYYTKVVEDIVVTGNDYTSIEVELVSITTGILVRNMGEKEMIHLSPNPASDKIFLDAGPWKEMVQMEILDMTGQVLIARQFNFESSDRMELSVSSLPAGMYLVRLKAGKIKEIKKMIVF